MSETLIKVKKRPILFEGAMARALRDGSKTQTREIVAPAPEYNGHEWFWNIDTPTSLTRGFLGAWRSQSEFFEALLSFCPLGKVGDQLREEDSRLLLEITGVRVERVQAISEADAVAEGIEKTTCNLGAMCEGCFQGRKAAPHWKDYLGNKKRESIVPARFEKAADSYGSLWVSINGPESWAANPWVWVVEFKVIAGGKEVASV